MATPGEHAILATLIEAVATTVGWEERIAIFRPVYYAMRDQDWEIDQDLIDSDPALAKVVREYDPAASHSDIWAPALMNRGA
jgi:hypothetical protein